MKKNIVTNWLLALLLALGFAGCESGSSPAAPKKVETGTEDQPKAATEAAPTPAVDGRDQLDISHARMLRYGNPANARITRKLYAASKEGDYVNLSFENLRWPTQGDSKKVDADVYMFWKEGGTVVGGQFDAHKVGQTAKGLINIYGGILGGKQPPRGARIYFCLASFNGQRTNVAESQTRW